MGDLTTTNEEQGGQLVLTAEAERLIELEAVIDKGLRNFIEVAQALIEIHRNRLYRKDYKSWQTYLAERHPALGKSNLYHYMGAHATRDILLSHNCDESELPRNLAVYRVLKDLSPEGKCECNHRAKEEEKSTGRQITAARVAEIVAAYMLEHEEEIENQPSRTLKSNKPRVASSQRPKPIQYWRQVTEGFWNAETKRIQKRPPTTDAPPVTATLIITGYPRNKEDILEEKIDCEEREQEECERPTLTEEQVRNAILPR